MRHLLLKSELWEINKVQLSFKHSVAFFFGLVWLEVLQLHLIPTGKSSSGTDFRAPGLGWFPSGTQASSQSIWLKGAWLNYTQWPGPALRHDPVGKTHITRLWRVNWGCKYVHHTWGTPICPPQNLTQLTAQSVSIACLRGRVLCVTRDWVGKTVGSTLRGHGLCLLQSTGWILVGSRSEGSVLISLMPGERQGRRGTPRWRVTEDACV